MAGNGCRVACRPMLRNDEWILSSAEELFVFPGRDRPVFWCAAAGVPTLSGDAFGVFAVWSAALCHCYGPRIAGRQAKYPDLASFLC